MFGNQRKPMGKTETPGENFKPFTNEESDRISSALDRNLGPEFVSIRPGPGANKLSYLEGWKAIQLSNQIFGFNGWNTEVRNVQVDYIDEHSGKFSVGLSVIVRVTLKDGSYHEDIGYGNIENCRTKAAAFDKCKKEATTDAMKRALRQFGNALGNCLYDKNYISNVTKITKNQNIFDSESLIRGPDSLVSTLSIQQRSSVATPQQQQDQQQQQPQQPQQQTGGMNIPQQRQANRFQNAMNQAHPKQEHAPALSNTRTAPAQVPQKPVEVKTELVRIANTKPINSDLEDIIDDESFAFSDDILPDDLPDSEPEVQNNIDDYEMDLIMGKHESQAREDEEVKLKEDDASTTLTSTSGNGNPYNSYLTTPTPAAAVAQQQQHQKSPVIGNAPTVDMSSSQQPLSQQPANLPPAVWVSARLADEVNNNAPIKPDQIYNPNFASPSLRKTSNIDHSKSTPIKRSMATQVQNKENQSSDNLQSAVIKRNLGPPSKLQANKRQQRG